MSVLERSELEASPLADLHAIADQLGVDGFRRLRKPELIDAILGEAGEESAPDGAEEQQDEEGDAGRTAARLAASTARSTACPCASAGAAKLSAADGATAPSCHSEISSGRTPASTSVTSTSSRPPSAASMLRKVAVLPDRAPPLMTAREPSPRGVSHSIAASVGSSEPNASRALGYAAGRSS